MTKCYIDGKETGEAEFWRRLEAEVRKTAEPKLVYMHMCDYKYDLYEGRTVRVAGHAFRLKGGEVAGD